MKEDKFELIRIIVYNIFGDSMNSIKENTNSKIEIKKSIFYTDMFFIESEEDIDYYLKKIKEKYKDAKHYCYAYILEEKKHFSDDGEPSGTAGIPILNVLEKNQLNHILCIVTRYFGGILLGAGGLVRAYTKGVTEALSNTKITPLTPAFLIEVIFPYDSTRKVDSILNKTEICQKKFEENVCYHLFIPSDQYNLYIDQLTPYIIKINIIKSCFL